jgi:hypothetical protein
MIVPKPKKRQTPVRKTIKKVIIVVEVLMTSCHVSEKPKIEPEIAHKTRSMRATIKEPGALCPAV